MHPQSNHDDEPGSLREVVKKNGKEMARRTSVSELQREILQRSRQTLADLLLTGHSIDELIQHKLDDFSILQELPCAIRIGKHSCYVANFQLDNHQHFYTRYGVLLGNIRAQLLCADTMGERAATRQTVKEHRKLRREGKRLLKATLLMRQHCTPKNGEGRRAKLPKCGWRYFQKHMSLEKVLQAAFLVYLYNFESVRKNLRQDGEKDQRKTSFGNAYVALLAKCNLNDRDIFATSIAKCRLLIQRMSENNCPPKGSKVMNGVR